MGYSTRTPPASPTHFDYVESSRIAESAAASAAAAVNDFHIRNAFETSEARVNLIGKRVLVARGYDATLFFRAVPLEEKSLLRIFFDGDEGEEYIDASIRSSMDVEQMEAYRANKIVYDRWLADSHSSSECTLL